MANVYEIVTERLIGLLEQGTAPWRKTWTSDAPTNLISGREYRGINLFLLACAPYASPFWVTFRQAKQRGGHVKKGEKAWPITFWKLLKSKEDPDKNIPMLRFYSVFNLAQCEGIEDPSEAEAHPFEPIEQAEQIVAQLPENSAPIREGGTPCYVPASDEIRMPAREAFHSPEEYYSTAYHELGHSTGHETRLNRPAVMSPSFGSHDYSREELVAEMTAAYLCQRAGIAGATLDNQAAYLAGWIKVLRGDSRMAVQAASAAQKAADWLLGTPREEELTEAARRLAAA